MKRHTSILPTAAHGAATATSCCCWLPSLPLCRACLPPSHRLHLASIYLPPRRGLHTQSAICFSPPFVRARATFISRSIERERVAARSSAGNGMMEEGHGVPVVSWVVSGVVFWSTAFLFVRALLPKRSYDFCNRAVSTMHGVAGVVLGCLSVQDWASPVSPVASPSSPRQMRALAVTLSYMIYDAACCHLSGDARLDNALHHLISIVGLAAGLIYQRSGTELVACLIVTEITAPLLHLREMLKEVGIKDTDLNLLVDVLFAATFSVARMVCGTYVTYRTVTADNPILIKTMATSLLLVSAYWFLRILRMVRHKLGKKRPAKVAAAK